MSDDELSKLKTNLEKNNKESSLCKKFGLAAGAVAIAAAVVLKSTDYHSTVNVISALTFLGSSLIACISMPILIGNSRCNGYITDGLYNRIRKKSPGIDPAPR